MSSILIVDDDTAVLTAIQKTLVREKKYEVEAVNDGEMAIKILSDREFDLVITDIIMPNKEGFELITYINSKYPKTKIMAISGGGRISSEQYLTVAKKIGADFILQKPFSVEELLTTVNRALSQIN